MARDVCELVIVKALAPENGRGLYDVHLFK